MNTYSLGDQVRTSVAFTQVSDSAAIDPDVVKMSFITPSGTVTTYVYGTDDEIVKSSTGNYYADISLTEKGTWYYRWFSTGTGQAATEERLEVETARAV